MTRTKEIIIGSILPKTFFIFMIICLPHAYNVSLILISIIYSDDITINKSYAVIHAVAYTMHVFSSTSIHAK